MAGLQSYVEKFGRNADVDAAEDIIGTGGSQVWPAVGGATHLVSTDNADHSSAGTGARTVEAQGLDTNGVYFEENVSLTGDTGVQLVTEVLRLFRIKVLTAGSSESNEGAITAHQLYGETGETVIASMEIGMGQTLLGVYTIPGNSKGGYIKRVWSTVLRTTSGGVTMALQVRPSGGAWNTKLVYSLQEDQKFEHEYKRGPEVGTLTDIRLRALSVSVGNMDVAGGFDIELDI